MVTGLTSSLRVAHATPSPHPLLALGVHPGGRLVQQHHRRVAQDAQREAQLQPEEQRVGHPPARGAQQARAPPYLSLDSLRQGLRRTLLLVLQRERRQQPAGDSGPVRLPASEESRREHAGRAGPGRGARLGDGLLETDARPSETWRGSITPEDGFPF